MSPSYAKSRPIDIAGFNFDTQQTSGGQASGSPTPGTQGTAVSGNPLPFDYRRPEASERMANDKLGEELAPDATIWKLYLEEAAEYDRELVEGQHKSLDMLLLFAALFSAILTAFLIESKELLQQNPQDATFALQLLMAQSQYRMEHGLPPPESDNVPSAPQFSVSGLARSINGLWFTSLGLSLSAALIAMLGKEWLTAFLASRPRAAHPHALLRQARLQGLERWWALHIIAFLPSLLHASLLLFSVGLVIYLWILDHAIAAVLASVVAMTTLFYVVTAVLGAIYDYCPFVTELSKYVRQGVVALIRPKSFNKKNGDKSPSYEDLQALLWLFNNARDPAVVECSYQALSGLNTSSQALDFDITNGIIDQASLEKFDIWSKLSIPVQVDDNTTVTSLLRSIIDRFQRAIVDPQILLSSHQSSLPRLLNAIVALACHTYRPYLELTGDISTKDALEMRRLGVASDELAPSRLLSLFHDQWDHNHQAQSPDSYASLLIAEYQMMLLVFRYLQHTASSSQTQPRGLAPLAITSLNNLNTESYPIDVFEQQSGPEPSELLSELQRHYCAWSSRVEALLLAHAHGRVTVSLYSIERLLFCMLQSKKPYRKDGEGPTNTDWSRITTLSQIQYDFHIPIAKSTYWRFCSEGLPFGPLLVLLVLLKRHLDDQSERSLQVSRAALTLYSILCPQYFSLDPGAEAAGIIPGHSGSDRWPNAQLANPRDIRYVIMSQALLTFRYMGTTGACSPDDIEFCDVALRLCDATLAQDQLRDNIGGSFAALAQHSADLVPLISMIKPNSSTLQSFKRSTLTYLVNLSQMHRFDTTETPCHISLTPETFPPLLAMIGVIKDWNPSAVRTLVEQMILRIRAHDRMRQNSKLPLNDIPSIEYIYPFTRSPEGFTALASACSSREYEQALLVRANDFTCLAAGRDPAVTVEPVELLHPAVGPFLEVISIMAKRCQALEGLDEIWLTFAENALILLEAAAVSVESRTLMKQHSAHQDMVDGLGRLNQESRAIESIARVRSLESKFAASSHGIRK